MLDSFTALDEIEFVIEIPCEHCKGKGSVQLPKPLAQTLAAVKSGNRTSDRIRACGQTSVSITAINNRLERLRQLGFVTREREGRSFHYTIKKGNH